MVNGTIVLIAVLGLLAVIAVIVHLASGQWIEHVADPYRLHSLEDIPESARIVVLGCRPRTRTGRPNSFFVARVAAAAAAYHHTPGRRILCSGRLDPDGLHEAEELAKALTEASVPPRSIDLDPDSQRTIDSIAHLAAHHAGEPILLITQHFHLTRALFLARRAGLTAYGLAAGGTRPAGWMRLREAFARSRAVFESLFSHAYPAPDP